MIEHKNIHEAINAVMREVGYVQKQKSEGLKYTYAGEASLIEAVRPSMVEHGVYMYLKEVKKINRENYATKSGTAMANTLVVNVIRFQHAHSDTFIDVEAIGEGADAGDKSGNKASTGSYKYAIRQTFCIETGDDPDRFPSDQMERATNSSKETEKSTRRNAPETQEAVSVSIKAQNGVPEPSGGQNGKLAVKDLKLAENVIKIKEELKKNGQEVEIPNIMKVINALEKSHSYTVGQVVDQILGVSE